MTIKDSVNHKLVSANEGNFNNLKVRSLNVNNFDIFYQTGDVVCSVDQSGTNISNLPPELPIRFVRIGKSITINIPNFTFTVNSNNDESVIIQNIPDFLLPPSTIQIPMFYYDPSLNIRTSFIDIFGSNWIINPNPEKWNLGVAGDVITYEVSSSYVA